LEQLGATDLFEFIKPVNNQNKNNSIIRPLQPRTAPTTFQPVSKCFGFEMEADEEEEVENISEQFSNSSSSNNTSNNSC